MKKPKPKKPKGRVRRNPYARALELATRRHDKALEDFTKFQQKIAALQIELPRLEQMKRVLEEYLHGKSTAPPSLRLPGIPSTLPDLGERKPSGPLPANPMDVVPAHLRHMITEHPSITRGSAGAAHGMAVPVDIDPVNEDTFLPEPEGTELLP